MPIIIDPTTTHKLSIQDFIEHANSEIDLRDAESVAAAAPEFKALANDHDLLANYLNDAIKRYFDLEPLAAYTPQSIFLGHGRGFFLRANIWTPLKLEKTFRSQEERVFSYRNTHDHNFTFMTVGYFGPGYETDLYCYDPTKVHGYVGEAVDLEYVGRTMLPQGRVMVYRNKVDVHTQFPPETLSISLNVMITNERPDHDDQYFFDPESGRIIEMPQIALVHKRASIVALAGMLANDETVQVLEDLIRQAPCRRVREAAVTAASHLHGFDISIRSRLLTLGANDREDIVRNKARVALQSFAT